jgi:hypothetical protein
MIFTTNKSLSEWGKVLHDEDLAAAILDRVLERGRFIHLDGPSGRTRHLHSDQALPSQAERLRISGINGSEFTEPTSVGVQQKLMRHAHVSTTMDQYGNASALAKRKANRPVPISVPFSFCWDMPDWSTPSSTCICRANIYKRLPIRSILLQSPALTTSSVPGG